jgi:hypothetical protein
MYARGESLTLVLVVSNIDFFIIVNKAKPISKTQNIANIQQYKPGIVY